MTCRASENSYRMSSYLVTGCAGFIGARVSERLTEQGHRVTGIDNLGEGSDLFLREWRLGRLESTIGFEFRRVDIRDAQAVSDVIASTRPDAVINLGAKTGVRASVEAPRLYAETNYMAVINLLESCKDRGVGKFVQASTSSVYGSDTRTPFQEASPSATPLSPYAASKKAAEELCYTYHHLYGLDVTMLRFFTVYGPAGRPDMSVFRFIKAIVEEEPITLYGDGGERDFTYVDDIARGVVAATVPMGYRIINLGAGRPIRISSLISMIERMVGKQARTVVVPRPAADVDSTCADISEAQDLLSWQPAVALQTGVAETLRWYIENRSWAKDMDQSYQPMKGPQ